MDGKQGVLAGHDTDLSAGVASRDWKAAEPPLPTSPPQNEQLRFAPLALFLPPVIVLLGIKSERRRHQPFPSSMSTKDGISVYFGTYGVSFLFFYCQAQLLERYCPYAQRDSLTAMLIWWMYLSQYRIGVYSCLYPFMYAILLRAKNGDWPSRIQVLGSIRAQEIELEREGQVRRSGVVGLLKLLLSYTWVGAALVRVLAAWKEGLGQEEFIRERRMRELEEARLKIVEEEKRNNENAARLLDIKESENDSMDE
ncbi:hypothetical protein VTL71DRAFT_7652 [Oculimacula yallundae]|uniref:Uncharacterized protein n=1 Tax=Oculimacula yallundae TaxID=86028 RepID=A0ABR4BUR8_9HELO